MSQNETLSPNKYKISEKPTTSNTSIEAGTTLNITDDKNVKKKKEHRSHSPSGGLSTTSRETLHSTSADKSKSPSSGRSPHTSMEMKNLDVISRPQAGSSSTPKASSTNLNVQDLKIEISNAPLPPRQASVSTTPEDSETNTIEYWKQRCTKLMQELQEVRAENRALHEKIRQQELLIDKFILKNAPKTGNSDLYTKISLAQFKRTSHPPIMNKPDLDERTHVAIEIFTTEQSYLTSLDIVINNYLIPLRKLAMRDKEKENAKHRLDEDDLDTIFGNIEQLFRLNKALYEELEKRLEQWETHPRMGDIFKVWGPQLKPYGRYASNFENAAQKIEELKAKNPKFLKLFQFLDANSKEYNGLVLRDYLIMPIQRIPRYSLLLQDLLRKTNKNHPDYEDLETAVQEVERVATYVNEQIRQFQNEQKLLEIYTRGGVFDLLKEWKNPSRRFIYSTVFDVVMDVNNPRWGKKEGEVILFSDILLSSNFLQRKGCILQDVSQPVPLIWVITEIEKNERLMEILTEEGLTVENGLVVSGPEHIWFLKAKSLKDKIEFINVIAQTLQIDPNNVVALSEGPRMGAYTFSPPLKGSYEGEWLATQIHGKGRFTNADGTIFDGHWDLRFQAGFGTVFPPGNTTDPPLPYISGWANNRAEGKDIEAVKDQHGLWGIEGLTDRDWQLILLGAREVTFKKNEKVITQGVTNENLFRIKSGIVRVEKQMPDGSRVVLTTMGPEAMFGDTSVLHTLSTATADVIADSDTVVLYAIEINLVFELFRNNPGLCMRFYKQMAMKLSARLRNLHNPKKDKKKDPAHSGSKDASESKASNSKQATGQDKKEKKEKSKHTTGGDLTYCEKFDLPQTEVVIKELACWLKQVMRKLGRLYISQNYLCFESHVFGHHSKDVIALNKVTELSQKKGVIKIKAKNKKYSFIIEQGCDEIYSLITNLWETAKLTQQLEEEAKQQSAGQETEKKRRTSAKDIATTTTKSSNEPSLTEDDWRVVLQGASSITVTKNQYIIQEGEEHQRIYQIVEGKCRIEKKTADNQQGGNVQILGYMEPGSLFGEMSFLEGGGATVSVVAHDDKVILYVIEGYFINLLFVRYPDLAGRFYHYLSSVLANRLNKREVALQRLQQATSEDSSTSDDSSGSLKKQRKVRALIDFEPHEKSSPDLLKTEKSPALNIPTKETKVRKRSTRKLSSTPQSGSTSQEITKTSTQSPEPTAEEKFQPKPSRMKLPPQQSSEYTTGKNETDKPKSDHSSSQSQSPSPSPNVTPSVSRTSSKSIPPK